MTLDRHWVAQNHRGKTADHMENDFSTWRDYSLILALVSPSKRLVMSNWEAYMPPHAIFARVSYGRAGYRICNSEKSSCRINKDNAKNAEIIRRKSPPPAPALMAALLIVGNPSRFIAALSAEGYNSRSRRKSRDVRKWPDWFSRRFQVPVRVALLPHRDDIPGTQTAGQGR